MFNCLIDPHPHSPHHANHLNHKTLPAARAAAKAKALKPAYPYAAWPSDVGNEPRPTKDTRVKEK